MPRMPPRSQNLDDKPQMKAWLNNDTPATRTFMRVINYLCSHYTGTNQGYTDSIDYRFNSNREGGYILVKGKKIDTIIRIGRSKDAKIGKDKAIVNNPEVSNETLEKTLSEFLIEHKVRDFDFSSNYNIQLEKEVEELLELSPQDLLKKIKDYPTTATPEKISITTVSFQRNKYIIAYKLLLADGKCECCKKPAPFFKKGNPKKPYLEVHHVTPLSVSGEDTVENTIALCPNCHREKHFSIVRLLK